jgi:hypothetical protein
MRTRSTFLASLRIPLALVLTAGTAVPALAARTAPDACELVPLRAVSRIVGKDMAIARRSAPAVRDGVTRSSCIYQGSGSSGVITVTAFADSAAAEAYLATFTSSVTAAGGTVEQMPVGDQAASLVTPAGGSAQLFLTHDDVLLGIAVATRQKGASTPAHERSRELAAAAVGKL